MKQMSIENSKLVDKISKTSMIKLESETEVEDTVVIHNDSNFENRGKTKSDRIQQLLKKAIEKKLYRDRVRMMWAFTTLSIQNRRSRTNNNQLKQKALRVLCRGKYKSST